ncbi:hypothetical protein ACS0TY_003359 [Phlomoides rotata]
MASYGYKLFLTVFRHSHENEHLKSPRNTDDGYGSGVNYNSGYGSGGIYGSSCVGFGSYGRSGLYGNSMYIGGYGGLYGGGVCMVVEECLIVGLEEVLEVIMFSSEVPSRFGISYLGSQELAELLKTSVNVQNISFTDAANFAGYAITKDLSSVFLQKGSYSGFVELHIEQEISIGVVTAIAAPASIKVEFEGNGGHAGSVLMPKRNDAGLAAAEFALAVEKHVLESGLIDTVGTGISCLGRYSQRRWRRTSHVEMSSKNGSSLQILRPNSRFLLADPQKMQSKRRVSVKSVESQSGLTSGGRQSTVLKLLHLLVSLGIILATDKFLKNAFAAAAIKFPILPLALKDIPASSGLKILCIIVGGWLASLSVAGFTAIAVRKMVNTEMIPAEPMHKPSPFSSIVLWTWSGIFLISFVSSLLFPTLLGTNARACLPFLLASTVVGYIFGSGLPSTVKKVFHPIICRALSSELAAFAYGKLSNFGLNHVLGKYLNDCERLYLKALKFIDYCL